MNAAWSPRGKTRVELVRQFQTEVRANLAPHLKDRLTFIETGNAQISDLEIGEASPAIHGIKAFSAERGETHSLTASALPAGCLLLDAAARRADAEPDEIKRYLRPSGKTAAGEDYYTESMLSLFKVSLPTLRFSHPPR